MFLFRSVSVLFVFRFALNAFDCSKFGLQHVWLPDQVIGKMPQKKDTRDSRGRSRTRKSSSESAYGSGKDDSESPMWLSLRVRMKFGSDVRKLISFFGSPYLAFIKALKEIPNGLRQNCGLLQYGKNINLHNA